MSSMSTLLAQAAELRLLRALDIQFARLLADDDGPRICWRLPVSARKPVTVTSACRCRSLPAKGCSAVVIRSWRTPSGRPPASRRTGRRCWRTGRRSAPAIARRRWCCVITGSICTGSGITKGKWRASSSPGGSAAVCARTGAQRAGYLFGSQPEDWQKIAAAVALTQNRGDLRRAAPANHHGGEAAGGADSPQ